MPRNKAIILLSAGHACVDVYQGSMAALVPFFAAERAYGYAAVSGIVLAASLLSSVAQPLFGALTDRWAMPWLLPSSTILGGLGIGLGGLVDSYALTLVFVAVSGIGVAAYHPEAARVTRIAGGGRHTAMGWFSLGGNVGFAAAPVLVTAVMALGGLRMSPLLVLPALAGSVLCLPVLRALARTARTGGPAADVVGVDDWRSFTKLSLAVVFRSIVFVGLSTFVSLYAQQRTGGGTTTGSAALFLLYLGGAGGTLLGSRLAGRWDRVTVVRRSYLGTIAAVAGVVLVPGPAFFPFVLLAAVGLYIPFSLQITLAQDYLPHRVGTASGVTLGLTVSIGGLASPVLGTIADHTSLRTALIPLIALPFLCWITTRTLSEPCSVQIGTSRREAISKS
ncbi:MFS transporter [Amycolatopsis sp. BJA-103]|uniref:MFS transporter n=1 Tax=Amycolatopsis sp. BJA-103 TaxID=1911175 RepID=UPI000C777A55|nr:MFS transporter [Amycolatopsis sp. BJA-103]AUI57280.1 MFS transporter [Amycolatopsis sp. BJA-103]PNE13289.1 MFS transporter [Amycolatopsis sp. BJA-103]